MAKSIFPELLESMQQAVEISKGNKMGKSTVLNVIRKVDNGTHTLSLMGHGNTPTHVHIDNYKSGKNSVIVPLRDVCKLLDANHD